MRILKTTLKLPNGKWLAKQREQNSLTIQQIASAVQWHPLSVRALETRNRVVPPGWKKALAELGIKLPMPTWPRTLPFYSGADLKRDMDTRAGMRHSRFWLSNQLGVTEETIDAVLQCNLPVPHDWLLKLAELGADVPEVVRVTLFQPLVDATRPAASPAELDASAVEPAPHTEKQSARFFWPAEDQPDAPLGTATSACVSEGSDKRLAAPAALGKEHKPSLFVSWTEEAGLHVSLSTALLDQIPAALTDLLLTLSSSSLPKAAATRLSSKTAEPSRG